MSWTKRKGKWVLTVGPLEWSGERKADLVERALADLAEVLDRVSDTPQVFRVPGEDGAVVVLHQGAQGVVTQWYRPVEGGRGQLQLRAGGSSSYGEESMREAGRGMRRNLAQLEYGASADAAAAHAVLEEGDVRGHAELAGWIAWQEGYAAARALGKSDAEAREPITDSNLRRAG